MIVPQLSNKCQVCGIRFPLILEGKDYPVVVSSSIAPWSLAKCFICLDYQIEPIWLVTASIEIIGKDNLADWFMEVRTILNGRFVEVQEYLDAAY